MKRIVGLLVLLSLSASGWADDAWYGTWVERSAKPLTMTVEPSGGAARFTYKMPAGFTPNMVMSFETRFDGQEVPVMVDGRPSGQTMAIKRIDGRHTVAVMKFQGNETGTSKSELSGDGKVLKVDSDSVVTGPNGAAGKTTQFWDKQ